MIVSFNGCDRGDTYVDHHVFSVFTHPKTGLNHLSFEVPNIDDVWWVRRARDAGIEFVVVSPNSNDAPDFLAAQWVPIRPNTDAGLTCSVAQPAWLWP